MSTAKFRGMITEFKRYIRPEPIFRDWKVIKYIQEDKYTPEDRLIREMIDNVDFMVLYRSIEFRKQLRERLNYLIGKKYD